MQSSKVLLGILAVGMVLFGFLLFNGFRESAAFYYTIDELSAAEASTRTVRVKGMLEADSVHYVPSGPYLEFVLSDGSHQLKARYHGAAPDNFMHADEVIVEGQQSLGEPFHVSKLMLQCPSKYEVEDGG